METNRRDFLKVATLGGAALPSLDSTSSPPTRNSKS